MGDVIAPICYAHKMIKEKLIDYIHKEIDHGHNDFDISEKLKKYHYDPVDIKETLEYIHGVNAKKKHKLIFSFMVIIVILLGALFLSGQNKNYIIVTDDEINLQNFDIDQEQDVPIIKEKENDVFSPVVYCGDCQYLVDGRCLDMECCEDSDCEDGNDATRNVCKGEPKVCFDIVVIPCDEGNPLCEKSNILNIFSGKAKDSKKKKDIPFIPIDANQSVVETILTDCNVDTECDYNYRCYENKCVLKECLEMGGKNCDFDQICDGNIVSSYENPRCCIGVCKAGEPDCVANYGEKPEIGCDAGCFECKCTDESSNLVYRYNRADWKSKICLFFNEFDESIWIEDPAVVCNSGNVDVWPCVCGNDYCGYVYDEKIWEKCEENTCKPSN